MFMTGGAALIGLIVYALAFAVLVLAIATGVVLGLRYDRRHPGR